MTSSHRKSRWILLFPPATWLAHYHSAWFRSDAIAGITLAACAPLLALREPIRAQERDRDSAQAREAKVD